MAEDQFNAGQLGLAKTIEEAMVKDMENPQLWMMGGRIAAEKSELETAYQRGRPSSTAKTRKTSPASSRPNHYYKGIIDQRGLRLGQGQVHKTYDHDEGIAYFLAKAEMMVKATSRRSHDPRKQDDLL